MGETGRLAVVLLSGGMDSATAAALASDRGFGIYALTVDYGQRSRLEIEAARWVSDSLGAIEHRVLEIDLASFGGSAITGDGEIPRGRKPSEISAGIPPSYVPARNIVLLALALAWAEAIGAEAVVYGVNEVDCSGYPDCTPEFTSAFQAVADTGLKRSLEGNPIEILAPLEGMTKSRIVELGRELGVDYSITTSCYDPGEHGEPCGECDSCLIRQDGFRRAGVQDPAAGGMPGRRE